MSQYVGLNCRPDICTVVQLVAPGADPTTATEFKTMKNIFSLLQNTMEKGLDYVKLGMDSVRIVVLTYASFANAKV